jgi:hypothetical protein
MAMITVDKATPMSIWKLPVAEILPISRAFSTFFHPFKASRRARARTIIETMLYFLHPIRTLLGVYFL